MRLPRVQFSVRWAMAATGVLAILIWSVLIVGRFLDFQKKAKFHGFLELTYRDMEKECLRAVDDTLKTFEQSRREAEESFAEFKRNFEIKTDAPKSTESTETVTTVTPERLSKLKAGTESLINEWWKETEKRIAIEKNRARLYAESALWHEMLKNKYQRAMRAPWLHVARDPPMPE